MYCLSTLSLYFAGCASGHILGATSEESRANSSVNLAKLPAGFCSVPDCLAEDWPWVEGGISCGSLRRLLRLMKAERLDSAIAILCFSAREVWISFNVLRANHASRISFRNGISLLWNGGVLFLPGIEITPLKSVLYHTSDTENSNCA